MCLLRAALININTRDVFSSFSLSQPCCLHFWRNELESMLAQGYSKGKWSTKFTKCYFFEPAQSICTHWMASLMRQKIPIVFFTSFSLSECWCLYFWRKKMDLCWRKDTLRVKGQALITNRNFYEFVQPICHLLVVSIRYAIKYPWCFYFI